MHDVVFFAMSTANHIVKSKEREFESEGRASFPSFCFIYSFLTMDNAGKKRRKEDRKKKEDSFRRSAFLIIDEMLELSPEHPSVLVDEILHSIFFLGKINTPQYNPKDIVSDEDTLNELRNFYPQPFEFYSSHLPKRSPMSCVLDMIVHLTGQKNEREIIQSLREFIHKLKEGGARDLISSTICVSQRNNTRNSVRYYGVSMSTSGSIPGRIIVAASCLNSWDSYVAGAVMTYYPDKKKKPDFDGTIKLPESVRCQAFNISQGEEMPPCRTCGNLFGLTSSENDWPPGNCAETESVSKLLKNDTEVREQVRPTSEMCTDANRQRAEEAVRKELMGYLRMKKFNWNKGPVFYSPGGV